MGPLAVLPQRVKTFKLFMSNLPPSLTAEELSQLMEPFGRIVELELFKTHYAFCHMEDEELGALAVSKLNRIFLLDREISVCVSKNSEGPKLKKSKLNIGNVPVGIHPKVIRDLFTKYAYVIETQVVGNTGFIILASSGEIATAVSEMNGFELEGCNLEVTEVSMPQEEKPSLPSSSTKKKRSQGKNQRIRPYQHQPREVRHHAPEFFPPCPPPQPSYFNEEEYFTNDEFYQDGPGPEFFEPEPEVPYYEEPPFHQYPEEDFHQMPPPPFYGHHGGRGGGGPRFNHNNGRFPGGPPMMRHHRPMFFPPRGMARPRCPPPRFLMNGRYYDDEESMPVPRFQERPPGRLLPPKQIVPPEPRRPLVPGEPFPPPTVEMAKTRVPTKIAYMMKQARRGKGNMTPNFESVRPPSLLRLPMPLMREGPSGPPPFQNFRPRQHPPMFRGPRPRPRYIQRSGNNQHNQISNQQPQQIPGPGSAMFEEIDFTEDITL